MPDTRPKLRVYIETRARDELREQARYIEKQRKGHGVLLLQNVKTAIKDILLPNIQWGYYRDEKTDPQFYEKHIVRFPMTVVYFKHDDDVYIVAISHDARKPGYWKPRLDDANYTKYR